MEEEGMGISVLFVCLFSLCQETERWENWKQGRIDFDDFLNYYYGMNKMYKEDRIIYIVYGNTKLCGYGH